MENKFMGYLPDTVDGIDEFGVHTKIAEAISEKIINADVTKHPLTLGLFGEWGSGKSFIVEKIHQDIMVLV